MKRIATLALAATVAGWTLPAGAADELVPDGLVPGKFTANVGIVSEYLFRGIAQSDDTPALQGGFDWAMDEVGGSPIGLYAGVWASNIDFHVGNHLEMDFYGGLSGKLPVGEGLAWKFGGIWYHYPNVPNDVNNIATHQDYGEIATSLGYDFGVAAATVMFNYSPDFFASTGHAEYLAFKLDIPIWKLTLSPIVGRQWIRENTQFGAPDYWHFGAAITAKVVGFDLTLAVSDTDIKKSECLPVATSNDVCDATVYFGVSRTF